MDFYWLVYRLDHCSQLLTGSRTLVISAAIRFTKLQYDLIRLKIYLSICLFPSFSLSFFPVHKINPGMYSYEPCWHKQLYANSLVTLLV